MEELRNEIEELKNSLSNVDDDKYKKYFDSIQSILSTMANKIEEVVVNQEAIEENMQFLDDELFEEVSIDELCDMEDEYVEINCAHCNKPIFMEKSVLTSKEQIPCPYCHENIK